MPEPTSTPMARSVELQLTGQPDTKNKYGSGSIRPERIVFYYLDDRTNAHLYGSWVREDGEVTDAPVDQLHRWDEDWPDWMTDRAREHDPRRQAASTGPVGTSRLEAAAQRALDSLSDLILNTPDPGVEALGAQFELRQAPEPMSVEERVARHLAAKDWLTTEDGWDTAAASFRADYLRAAREVIALAAVSSAGVVQLPPTNQAALRDRIAALFRHPPGVERLGDATPGEIADAVLAVLPAPVDPAAVLLEAADAIEADSWSRRDRWGRYEREEREAGMCDAAELLRRLAADAPATEEQSRG